MTCRNTILTKLDPRKDYSSYQIANETGYSLTHVRKVLPKMVEAGELVTKKGYLQRGSFNWYQINPHQNKEVS